LEAVCLNEVEDDEQVHTDTWSADQVILAQLTFAIPDLALLLVHSNNLASCHSRVRIAGCEVRPAWANGASLLIPVTQEQIAEAGIQLKAYNILMFTSDVQLVEQALRQLPRHKQPKLKLEYLAKGNSKLVMNEARIVKNVFCGYHLVGAWVQDAGLIVENTFSTFPIPPLRKDGSNASTLIQTSP